MPMPASTAASSRSLIHEMFHIPAHIVLRPEEEETILLHVAHWDQCHVMLLEQLPMFVEFMSPRILGLRMVHFFDDGITFNDEQRSIQDCFGFANAKVENRANGLYSDFENEDVAFILVRQKGGI